MKRQTRSSSLKVKEEEPLHKARKQEPIEKQIESIKNIEHNFITIDSIKTVLSEAKEFFAEYKKCIENDQGIYTKEKVEQYIAYANSKIEKYEGKTKPIKIAFVGGTGVGKTFILNSLATLDETISFSDLLPNSNKENDATSSGDVTVFTTKVHYAETIRLVAHYKPSLDNLTDEDKEVDLTETEKVLFTEDSNRSLIDNLGECKKIIWDLTRENQQFNNGQQIIYLDFKVPLKTLKKHNIMLMDIPGLTGDNEKMKFTAKEMVMEADVLFLVLDNNARGKIQPKDLNLIEPFLMGREPSDIPYLVITKNIRDSGSDSENDVKSIKDTLLEKLLGHQHDASTFLPNITGLKRGKIFQTLCLYNNGFTFYSDSHKKQITKESFRETVTDIYDYWIDKKLKSSLFKLYSAIYNIRKDLNNSNYFGVSDMKNYLDKLNKIQNLTHWSEMWSQICEELSFEQIDFKELENVKEVLDEDTFEEMLDMKFELSLDKVLNICYEIMCNALGLSYDEDMYYEYCNTVEEESQKDYNEKVDNIIVSAKDLTHKKERELPIEEKKLQYLEYIFKECKTQLTESSDKIKKKLKKETHSIELFYRLLNSLMKKSFTLKTFTTSMEKAVNWTKLSLKSFRYPLFTHNSLVDEAKNILKKLLKNSGKTGKQSVRAEVKKKITRWFKKQKNLTPELSTNDSDLKLEHLAPTVWNEYKPPEIENNGNNKRLNKSIKASLRSYKTFPTISPTSSMNNCIIRNDVVTFKEEESEERIIKFEIDFEQKKINILSYEIVEDLRKVLESTDSKIYPIFIPSKKRNNFVEEITFTKKFKTTFPNSNYLIFLVIEESELDTYQKSFEEYDCNLVFVTIPDRDRGIGFARACIKILQEQLRLHCLNNGVNFDWYWTIDDDVQEMRMFDINYFKSPSLMRPCRIDFVLTHCQNALKQIVENQDNRFDKKEGIYNDEFIDVKEELEKQLKETFQNFNTKTKDKLNTLFTNENAFMGFLKEVDNRNDIKAWEMVNNKILVSKEVPKFFHEWLLKFREKSEKIKRNINIGQLAIAKSSITRRINYNLLNQLKHYKASSEMHACILTYAPALIGYNYLPLNYMFLSQKEVDEQKTLFDDEGIPAREKRWREVRESYKLNDPKQYEYRDYFLGEDKKFVEMLEKDNRVGALMYCFDVVYGKKKERGLFLLSKSRTNVYVSRLSKFKYL